MKEKRRKTNMELMVGEKIISINIYKQEKDLLARACDETFIGKTFEEGKYFLD